LINAENKDQSGNPLRNRQNGAVHEEIQENRYERKSELQDSGNMHGSFRKPLVVDQECYHARRHGYKREKPELG